MSWLLRFLLFLHSCPTSYAFVHVTTSNNSNHRILSPFFPIASHNIILEEESYKIFDDTQEQYLDGLYREALYRVAFFMETDFLLRVENEALRTLFQTCVDSVYFTSMTLLFLRQEKGCLRVKISPRVQSLAFIQYIVLVVNSSQD